MSNIKTIFQKQALPPPSSSSVICSDVMYDTEAPMCIEQAMRGNLQRGFISRLIVVIISCGRYQTKPYFLFNACLFESPLNFTWRRNFRDFFYYKDNCYCLYRDGILHIQLLPNQPRDILPYRVLVSQDVKKKNENENNLVKKINKLCNSQIMTVGLFKKGRIPQSRCNNDTTVNNIKTTY